MPIEKVEQMTKAPVACVACGGNPTIEGKAQMAFDLDTDINWGDHGYLCIECSNVIADLLGRVDAITYHDLQIEYRKVAHENEKLRHKAEELHQQLKTIKESSQIINA